MLVTPVIRFCWTPGAESQVNQSFNSELSIISDLDAAPHMYVFIPFQSYFLSPTEEAILIHSF